MEKIERREKIESRLNGPLHSLPTVDNTNREGTFCTFDNTLVINNERIVKTVVKGKVDDRKRQANLE